MNSNKLCLVYKQYYVFVTLQLPQFHILLSALACATGWWTFCASFTTSSTCVQPCNWRNLGSTWRVWQADVIVIEPNGEQPFSKSAIILC